MRGGLGERRVFRVILHSLAEQAPETVRKNLTLIPEYGRFDDLLALMDTPCEPDALRFIRAQLEADLAAADGISLLAKWLPSVNVSNAQTVCHAKRIARALGMTDAQYRKTLSALRKKLRILENDLRVRDYSFDYEKLPAKALFKYRAAFRRNDCERYGKYLADVRSGSASMHTGTLMPYEIVAPCLDRKTFLPADREALDTAWNALPDYGSSENALAVVDGSGSMYWGTEPMPIAVALSLGLYFAERNRGVFRNHFITFSKQPQLVKIKDGDIWERARYCASFCEIANTDLAKVFALILQTAVKHRAAQAELPSRLYIISDMEFDSCICHAEQTNFDCARTLFEAHGYKLPEVVFWNVASRNRQQPVTMNEQGVALVSGCTPSLFSGLAGGLPDPYTVMTEILGAERYAAVCV